MNQCSSRPIMLGLLLAALTAGSAHAIPFTGMVVFADSLGDGGNNAFVFDNVVAPPGTPPGTLRTPTPIDSPTFIPTLPYASNRYSNGPVWVEQLAGLLGLPLTPSTSGGTNFAFGGARTGPSGSSFPFSLLDQVDMFLDATGGVAPAGALYIVEGGGNDARDILATAAGGGDPTPLIDQYAADIEEILLELSVAGADHILLANVPDLGKAPAILAMGPGASALASGLVLAMNAELDATVAGLPTEVGSSIHEFDLFSLIDAVAANPEAFGLIDATSACAFEPSCIAAPSRTFFWDGIHPTTAGHAIFAAAALQVVPEPATAWLLALAFVAFAIRRARAR